MSSTEGVVRAATGAAIGISVIRALRRAVRRGDPGKVKKICVEAGLTKKEQRELIEEAREEKLRRQLRAKGAKVGRKKNQRPLSNDPATLRGQIGAISISKRGEFARDKFTVINHPQFDEDNPRVSHDSFEGARIQADATRRVLSRRATRIQRQRDREAFGENNRMKGADQRDKRGGSGSMGSGRRGSFKLKGSKRSNNSPINFSRWDR